ncbi:MAG: aminotransferase class V-fold PLP-dependent enzyme [Myxococcales bacterium]|nr:aminotransferase class V-fold PLP-dependent enzyme [Myxococcales bacterium]
MSYQRTHHLLAPGPVNVARNVADALTLADICHREDEFEHLLVSVTGRLLEVAALDPSRYAAVVITGSGTAANEAVLSSVVERGGAVVALSNGEFGERLADISKAHCEVTFHIEHGWGAPLELERLERVLAANEISLVTMVHHETSSGMLNPVAEVGAICARHGVRLHVDAVSSFGSDRIDMEACGITFMTSSAGKALASYPGLSVVFGAHSAFAGLVHRARTRYLDLGRHYRMAQERHQTPNTPAVPLFMALDQALANILAEGMEARAERLAALQAHLRDRLGGLGLEPLLGADVPQSNVLTTVQLPEEISYEALRLSLRARGFVVYGGKGPFEGRVFQVSAIGAIDEAILDAFFVALGESLETLRAEAASRCDRPIPSESGMPDASHALPSARAPSAA